MDEDRMDLSPLDPSADTARWDRMVASVVARGMDARAAARRPSVADLLALWRRPALALAAVLAIAAVPVLLFAGAEEEPAGTQGSTVAQAVVEYAWADTARPIDLLDAYGR